MKRAILLLMGAYHNNLISLISDSAYMQKLKYQLELIKAISAD